jgi:nuclear transport factor 2 (NTF2) superfamily protein
MTGVLVDPLAKAPAFERARELLGLAPVSRAHRLVRDAERAYQAQDLGAIMRLLHPDIVIVWNGERVAVGLDEARRFHRERLGFGEGRRLDYHLTKTMRAAQGDTICVEWVSTYRTPDGQHVRSAAGEFWTMRGDWLIEWHAYNHRVESP